MPRSQAILLSTVMLLRFKITLLAVFVLSTLLGIAASNMKVLLAGLLALGLALATALAGFLVEGHRGDRSLHSSR